MAHENQKPELYSYRLVQKLPAFFDEVNNLASNQEGTQRNGKVYSYVAIAERRCFNLFFAYNNNELPDTVSTFQGLLTQAKVIAESYVQSKSFPSILLVDDSLVHGRRFAKFIHELESSLLLYLHEDRYFSTENENDFQRDFLNAIDLFVFAKPMSTLLLDDRLIARLQSYMTLSFGQLRDLSLQLSDVLIRWNTPNANYSPSVYLKSSFTEKTRNGWMKVIWEYEKEDMILFCRTNDRENPRWLSTIRVFPMRSDEDGLIPFTSYSILNAIPKQDLDALCGQIAALLEESRSSGKEPFVQLRRLLRSENVYLEGAKRDFVNYLVSLFDLISFVQACEHRVSSRSGQKYRISVSKNILDGVGDCQELPEKRKRRLRPADYRIDTHRIALSFGSDHVVEKGVSPVSAEFDALLSNLPLYKRLEDCVQRFFRNSASQSNGNECQRIEWISTDVIEKNPEFCQTVNMHMLRQISKWGFESEEKAYTLANMPYNFHPASYQEYTYKDREESFGRDGGGLITSTLDFLKRIISLNDSDKRCHSEDLIFYLASYLFLMDVGVLGNKGYCTSDAVTATRLKAGEKATLCFPQSVAPFIPAFVYIENCFGLLSSYAVSAIAAFYDAMLRNLPTDEATDELARINKWDQHETKEKLETCERLLPNRHSLYQYTKRMYAIGQTFSELSFSNIIYPEFDFFAPLSKFFVKKAAAFMERWSA